MYLQPRKRFKPEATPVLPLAKTPVLLHSQSPAASSALAAAPLLLSSSVRPAAASSPVPSYRFGPAAGASASAQQQPSRPPRFTRVRPYPCRVCGVMLSSASNRLRHERSKHASHSAVTPSAQTTPAGTPGTSLPSPPAGLVTVGMELEDKAQDTMLDDEAADSLHAATTLDTQTPVRAAAAVSPSQWDDEGSFAEPAAAVGLQTTSSAPLAVSSVSSPLGDASDAHPLLRMLEKADTPAETASLTTSAASEEVGLAPSTPPSAPDPAVSPSAAREFDVDCTPPEESKEAVERREDAPAVAEAALQLGAPTAAAASIGGVPLGMPILNEEELQRSCYRFLEWLTQPPMTQIEALVKGRSRVNSMAQLQPIRLNLRFLFALLQQRDPLLKIDLRVWTSREVCQGVYDALIQREVGSGRVHALFLLLKKILVFLTSERSARQREYIQPSECESFFFVEGVCSESSYKRKQQARNRRVLGLHGSQRARQGLPNSRAPFKVPTTWSSSSSSEEQESQGESGRPPLVDAPSPSPDSNELAPGELKRVAQGSLQMLHELLLESDAPSQHKHLLMPCLVTAILSLAMAPRSQVLRQLRIGQTFIKESDGRYWVKMPAELNKHGKPTLFALPTELTTPFDVYLQRVRPRLLRGEEHNYVFFKKNGSAPRSDFSELTATATLHLIGRPVNAHAFRSAVITTFYGATGVTQTDMDSLATIMAHDPSTARNYYYRPQAMQSALGASDRMLGLLQVAPHAPPVAPAQML